MRKNIKLQRWGMLVVWMAFIFLMSQQPGDESSKQSDLVVKVFSLLGLNLSSYFGDLATFVVRKTAHFSEYFILFILFYRVMKIYVQGKMAKLYSVVCVFLYAASDEFHQLFIDGRTAAFRDVLIDTSGGIFSCIIITIIEKLKSIHLRK